MKKFLPKLKNNPKGFTLVELLVVITIIAILAVVGISAFSGAQRTARDGRRRADIESIAKAMESRFNPATGVYTAIANDMFASNLAPTDPGSNTYYTTLRNTSKGFDACANLENPGTGNSSEGNGNAPVYTSGTKNFYCVSSQQSQ